MPETLIERSDGVPWAVQVIEYLPRLHAYRWRDCLGRGHVRPLRWFQSIQMMPVDSLAVLWELEQRVREWWIDPAGGAFKQTT